MLRIGRCRTILGEMLHMTTATVYPHLTVDDQGNVRVGTTRYKVKHLAGEHYHYGWTAEELLRQHPDLRPEEVYASLTYFYDHFEEMVDELKAETALPDDSLKAPTLSRAELLRRRSSTK
jgi:uncharacterized protein (DUF433 family)